MLGLLAASVWCWAIIIDKTITYRRTLAEMNRFERVFWSGQSLEELYQQQSERATGGLGAVFVAAMKEWKRSHEQNAASFVGMQQRLDKVLDVAIARESEHLEKRLSFLATIGSAAPFIGLFGTVWGIMNAFTTSPPRPRPISRSSQGRSPRHCLPPPSVWLPPFLPLLPTTSFPRTRPR